MGFEWLPQSPLYLRCKAMLLGWGSIGVAYSLGSALALPGLRAAWQVPHTALDAWVTPQSSGVLLYLSLFVLVPYTFFSLRVNQLAALVRGMQWCAVVSGAVFVVWPSTMAYPAVVGNTWQHGLHRVLMAWDSAHNCLPSLHGALLVLCIGALWDVRKPWRTALLVGYGAAQCYAILQLRRHGAIDLVAGLCLGWAAHCVVQRRVDLCQRIKP